MKCKKCKSSEATIHVANVGELCLDCHNDFMAEMIGVNKTNDFPKYLLNMIDQVIGIAPFAHDTI